MAVAEGGGFFGGAFFLGGGLFLMAVALVEL